MRTIAITIMTLVVLMNITTAKDSFPFQRGKASWYSVKCNHGTTTASGIPLKNNKMTMAHKTLPMGTMVKVTNLANNKSQICQVTDFGPAIKNRIIDVTIGVAEKLSFVDKGITMVKLEVLTYPNKKN